jgi:cysteine desulfurase/selenocysteine lyase
MKLFDPYLFRKKFPLLQNHSVLNKGQNKQLAELVYFDNAATTQKPQQVINTLKDYYENMNANVHRASHQLSTKATVAFEQSRTVLQTFINSASHEELIWTKGTTESINIICQSLARNTLRRGDEILVCASEHHANIVPWQIVAEQTGAIIKVLPLTSAGLINISHLDSLISDKVKFIACAHISNVLGRINPIQEIIAKAKPIGAITVIDGAQAIAHVDIDVQALDCDFYVFSAHKMYGPTGVGVLYGKRHYLEQMTPYQSGGEMIKSVSFKQATTYNVLPFKLEAGTPNIAGVIGFGTCINFLSPLLKDEAKGYSQYENELAQYCYKKLASIPQVKFIVQGVPDIAIIAFTIKGHHNHDISTALDAFGISIRAGHHCAMPLMETLQIDGCLRVSLNAYNTYEEVDYFIDNLNQILITQNRVEHSDEFLPFEHKASKVSETALLQTKIVERFDKAKTWDSVHRQIMLMGKELPRLDIGYRNEETLISGCESKAWLTATCDEQGIYHFSADSDAKIIRGLLVIVLSVFNYKTSKQIKEFDVECYFKKLGLLAHLSPSRGNGLLAIVQKIKALI